MCVPQVEGEHIGIGRRSPQIVRTSPCGGLIEAVCHGVQVVGEEAGIDAARLPVTRSSLFSSPPHSGE